MELDKEIIKGYLESIILSLLKDEDLYGYEISKRVRAISNSTFEIKEGTLYAVLKRLENSSLIKGYWSDSESGGGRRRYYKITEVGNEFLLNKKREWEFFKEIIDKFFRGV